MLPDHFPGTSASGKGQAPVRAGTVVVYCAAVAMRAEIRAALQPRKVSREYRLWEDIFSSGVNGEPLIVVVLRPGANDLREIGMFRQCFPTTPLVVVTERDADSGRRLASYGIDEMVWSSDMRAELSGAVGHARSAEFFHALAYRIGRCERLAPLIRTALARAVRQPVPTLKVSALARLVGKHPGTLARHWKVAMDDSNTFRMEDFLAWMVLMRAAQRKSREGAWHLAAYAVCVDPRTLSRMSISVSGLTLHEIDEIDFFRSGEALWG